jgi:3-mercaptopyruvate sulfurtransferase SseA
VFQEAANVVQFTSEVHVRIVPRKSRRELADAAVVSEYFWHGVVTYCQGRYRSAHTYLALRLAGFPHVRNYTGSWKEWGDRADLPIEDPNRGAASD